MDMSGGEQHDHDHAHDHGMSSMDMGGMDHDKFHSAISRRPDGSYFYTHGAYLGHMVPGTFFILWGTWWLVATFNNYLKACSARRGFTARSWYHVFFGPEWLRKIPLEPLVKVVLPAFGVLGELWLGHPSWRTLIAPDGKFVTDNINDWQHSTMYSAFIASGVVDLLGHFAGLPGGMERGFLGLAFLVQGLLLAFHLKGPAIEIMVHYILVLQVFAIVVAIIAEAMSPKSVVVATARPSLTILQGVWWVQTAYIMYVSDPAYDPDEMGGTMMTPVVFVGHMIWIAFCAVLLLLTMRRLHSRSLGREIAFTPLKTYDAAPEGRDVEDPHHALEMAPLHHHK